jgi:ArsR family transcriptional regulator, virulence genes transcriptional regulator
MKTISFDITQMHAQSEQAASFLKSLANPVRLLALCHLIDGPLCVGELEDITNISQSALSQHLAKMRNEGLVKTQKQGQHVYYSIADKNVEVILGALYQMYCANL